MNNKTITTHQVMTITALSSLGGSILVITSTIAAVAKQDAWLSALISFAFSLLVTWLYIFLGTRYQGLTLIGLIQKIFGKWLGKVISLAYVLFFITVSYAIPWWIGNFGTHHMHETPAPVIIMIYMAVLVFGVYYGIEAIARASELFFAFVTVLLVLSLSLVTPNVKIDYALPVLENGFIPVLKGAYLLLPMTVFPFISLLMLFPVHASDPKGAKMAVFKGMVWCQSVVFLIISFSILVLGANITAKASFPTLLLAREINIAGILTRLEYIVSIMWTVSEFMIGMFFFYISLTSISELFGLSDHKKIVLPYGLVIFTLSWAIHPSTHEQAAHLITEFMPNATVFGFILPVIMLIVYAVKTAVKKKQG